MWRRLSSGHPVQRALASCPFGSRYFTVSDGGKPFVGSTNPGETDLASLAAEVARLRDALTEVRQPRGRGDGRERGHSRASRRRSPSDVNDFGGVKRTRSGDPTRSAALSALTGAVRRQRALEQQVQRVLSEAGRAAEEASRLADALAPSMRTTQVLDMMRLISQRDSGVSSFSLTDVVVKLAHSLTRKGSHSRQTVVEFWKYATAHHFGLLSVEFLSKMLYTDAHDSAALGSLSTTQLASLTISCSRALCRHPGVVAAARERLQHEVAAASELQPTGPFTLVPLVRMTLSLAVLDELRAEELETVCRLLNASVEGGYSLPRTPDYLLYIFEVHPEYPQHRQRAFLTSRVGAAAKEAFNSRPSMRRRARFAEEVKGALSLLGVEYEWNVQDRELGIHAVLKDQGDQPIALELCNAYLECKSTRRITGRVCAKLLLLQRMGYRPVIIRSSTWPLEPLARAEHLKGLLSRGMSEEDILGGGIAGGGVTSVESWLEDDAWYEHGNVGDEEESDNSGSEWTEDEEEEWGAVGGEECSHGKGGFVEGVGRQPEAHTVVELKAYLREAGEPVGGRKEHLVARVELHVLRLAQCSRAWVEERLARRNESDSSVEDGTTSDLNALGMPELMARLERRCKRELGVDGG